eukprot:6182725-Pyramimonas_sp.AAC.1
MGLAADFLVTVSEALRPFLGRRGFAALKGARVLCGRAARVAQVVPAATPFASALWSALGGAARASASG